MAILLHGQRHIGADLLAEPASDALFQPGDFRNQISPGIPFLPDREDLLGALIHAETASFAAGLIDDDPFQFFFSFRINS
jgi:hypothetical protein